MKHKVPLDKGKIIEVTDHPKTQNTVIVYTLPYHMESQVTFRSPQNIYGASQQKSVAILS